MKAVWKLFFKSRSEKMLKLNNMIYDIMIYGHCKEGSTCRAPSLLKEMSNNGMALNVASYSVLQVCLTLLVIVQASLFFTMRGSGKKLRFF